MAAHGQKKFIYVELRVNRHSPFPPRLHLPPFVTPDYFFCCFFFFLEIVFVLD